MHNRITILFCHLWLQDTLFFYKTFNSISIYKYRKSHIKYFTNHIDFLFVVSYLNKILDKYRYLCLEPLRLLVSKKHREQCDCKHMIWKKSTIFGVFFYLKHFRILQMLQINAAWPEFISIFMCAYKQLFCKVCE